jgi:hypothetical protein
MAAKLKPGDEYTGPVCYADGWHWTVVPAGDGGEEPDAKLTLGDDGVYRLAADDDASWHARKHMRYARVEMEGGQAGVEVSAEEFDAIQQMLREKRGGE